MIDPKKPVVYLPAPHTVKESGAPVLLAEEVYHALDKAGVKFIQETPEELQIRMLKLQIEELKQAYLELQDQHIELRDVCTALDDQNAALKMTASSLQSQLKAARDCNLTLETKLRRFEGLEEKHTELQDQNAALKMTAGMAQEELKALRLAGHYGEGKS